LGKFTEAFEIYYELYQNAKNNNNRLLKFRLLYCLKWVSNYTYSSDDPGLKSRIKEIDIIDAESEFFNFSGADPLDKDIATLLFEGRAIDYYGGKIRETVDKIRKHYFSQLRANYSSNNNYWELVNEFLTLINFTIANGLPYTKYTDFQNICNCFIEGIFLVMR